MVGGSTTFVPPSERQRMGAVTTRGADKALTAAWPAHRRVAHAACGTIARALRRVVLVGGSTAFKRVQHKRGDFARRQARRFWGCFQATIGRSRYVQSSQQSEESVYPYPRPCPPRQGHRHQVKPSVPARQGTIPLPPGERHPPPVSSPARGEEVGKDGPQGAAEYRRLLTPQA
jgi:hypothetical protein